MSNNFIACIFKIEPTVTGQIFGRQVGTTRLEFLMHRLMGAIKMQIRLPKNGQTEGPVNFVEEQSFNCMHI